MIVSRSSELFAKGGTMRRKKQEITDRGAIDEIIGRAQACHLAMIDGDKPYTVPMNFGYDGSNLYFHCAGQGRKVDVLKKNNNVCVCFEVDLKMETAEAACDWGINYKSVIAFGQAEFVADMEEKRTALDILMKQYSDKPFEFPPSIVAKTMILKVHVDSITAKHSS